MHHACSFLRFPYRAAQLLLLKATAHTKYGKMAVDSSASKLTRIDTLLALKYCCRVSCCRHCYSPIRNCSEV